MGEMIKMSVWVDVWSSSSQQNPPMIWTSPPIGGISKRTTRYQVDFEIPEFEPEVTSKLEPTKVLELADGKGVMVL